MEKNFENFNFNDGGRSLSKRPKQKKDCVVRAVAIACGVTYDEVYELFKNEGRRNNSGVPNEVWKAALEAGIFQTSFQYFAFPAEKGKTRMSILRFCSEYSSGTYIIQTAKHLSVVSGGILQDDSFYSNRTEKRCVYGAYQATKN